MESKARWGIRKEDGKNEAPALSVKRSAVEKTM